MSGHFDLPAWKRSSARFALVFCFFIAWSAVARGDTGIPTSAETKVALIFSGGHVTAGVDRGRPVILIAAALGVPLKVFREAFSHVNPAPTGQRPDPEQVRLNKEALLQRLAPYGVTNERLNEVSNYYRYRREAGELWRHVDAAGFAIVRGSKIVTIKITEAGTGYTSPPTVSLRVGITIYPMAVLAFGTDLSANGSISKIELNPIGDTERSTSFPSQDIQTQTQDVPLPSQTYEVHDTPAPSH